MATSYSGGVHYGIYQAPKILIWEHGSASSTRLHWERLTTPCHCLLLFISATSLGKEQLDATTPPTGGDRARRACNNSTPGMGATTSSAGQETTCTTKTQLGPAMMAP